MVLSRFEAGNILQATNIWRKILVLIVAFGVIIVLFKIPLITRTSLLWTSSNASLAYIKYATQEDPNLIYYIKNSLIKEPSDKPYNFSKGNRYVPPQEAFLSTYYKNKGNHTFIEVGAYDGEEVSNTFNLEVQKGWTGLLIEPNPISFNKLTSKNRKAKTLQCCLSDSRTPKMVSISLKKQQSKVFNKTKANSSFWPVWCYPLYSIMAATNLTTLDLLAIDLEGLELMVLKTLPWKKVNIKAILVEHFFVPGGKEAVKKYISKQNYSLVKDIEPYDFFFVKKV